MQGEVKITVIATGFGRKRAAMQAAPSSESTTIEYSRPVVEPSSRPIYSTEEDDLNIPAFLRNRH
jgi:hypothetical protein